VGPAMIHTLHHPVEIDASAEGLFTQPRRRGPTVSLIKNGLLNAACCGRMEEQKGYKEALSRAKGTKNRGR